MTVQINQASSAFATSISLRDTTTTDVNGVVISETSSATVITETSTPARTGIGHVANIDSMCNFKKTKYHSIFIAFLIINYIKS